MNVLLFEGLSMGFVDNKKKTEYQPPHPFNYPGEGIYNIVEMGTYSGGGDLRLLPLTDIPFLKVAYMLPSAPPLKATPRWSLNPLNTVHER